MNEHLKLLLLKSFDDDLSHNEQEELEKGLADNPDLRQEKEDIYLLRKTLRNQDYSFQSGFSGKIMRKIEAGRVSSDQGTPDGFAIQLYKLFRWVAPIGTAAIVIIFLSLYFGEGPSAIKALIGLNDLTIEDAITLSVFNYK